MKSKKKNIVKLLLYLDNIYVYNRDYYKTCRNQSDLRDNFSKLNYMLIQKACIQEPDKNCNRVLYLYV